MSCDDRSGRMEPRLAAGIHDASAALKYERCDEAGRRSAKGSGLLAHQEEPGPVTHPTLAVDQMKRRAT